MRISVPDTIIKLYAVMGHGSCTKIAVLWRPELSRESNLAKYDTRVCDAETFNNMEISGSELNFSHVH